jgi:GWxTD domain-containing protein
MTRPVAFLGGVVIVAVLCSSTPVLGETKQSLLSSEYSKWLNEDVHWIATDDERSDFLRLENGKARDEFIRHFWERRNPTPGSDGNSFKVEHYRRLAFANDHFAGRNPGWKTDRGRVYVIYGPPDTITPHAGSEIATPSQTWYYEHLGDKTPVSFEFVDDCRCGDYKLKK